MSSSESGEHAFHSTVNEKRRSISTECSNLNWKTESTGVVRKFAHFAMQVLAVEWILIWN